MGNNTDLKCPYCKYVFPTQEERDEHVPCPEASGDGGTTSPVRHRRVRTNEEPELTPLASEGMLFDHTDPIGTRLRITGRGPHTIVRMSVSEDDYISMTLDEHTLDALYDTLAAWMGRDGS